MIRRIGQIAALAAALWLASEAADAAPRASRPAAELRCIHDSLSATARDQVGESFWTLSKEKPGPAQILAPAARACVRQHGWGNGELEHASRYAMGVAAAHYFRARMAALGAPIAGWDEIYESLPVEERINASKSDLVRDRAIAGISLEQNARDPDALKHSAGFFEMRAMSERAERWWAGLPIS